LKILSERDEAEEINWISVAAQMKIRNNRQCRDRWHYHLRPNLKHKGDWSYEEDKIIVEKQTLYGNQ